jgi:hypothetical protein
MTEQDMHSESERLIEEAQLEIEAIKRVLDANRQLADEEPLALTDGAHVEAVARTN